MKIITVFPSYANKGGAEEISISIAQGLNDEESSVMMHFDENVFEGYIHEDTKFEKFNVSNIRKHHREGAIFMSHHRKTTTYLILLSYLLFGNKLRIVHVAHNTFSSLKRFSLFPSHNVAVSHTVKQNMIEYFGIPDENVEVIYNGLQDRYQPNKKFDEKRVNVLFLGRIDPVKQQVEFVKQTRGKLDDDVKIYFGGIGMDSEALKSEIGDDTHYEMLGLINIDEALPMFDYVCLFSLKEGLPLSLIEGQMFGKPLITNDIPQCLEINIDGVTGYVNHSWEEILNCLNQLPKPNSNIYKQLSINARNNYKNLFEFNLMIEKYKNYLQSLNLGM